MRIIDSFGSPDGALLHRTLPLNTKGRDFIVGDLHGSYAQLVGALLRVDFDPSCDRLICTGDLVDRGPDSLKVLGLLDEPWFHTVVGNHDLILTGWLGLPGYWTRDEGWYLSNGGRWVLELIRDKDTRRGEFRELLRLAGKLVDRPLVLSVEHTCGNFHVVHAQLCVAGRMLMDRDLQGRNASWLGAHLADLIWGRDLISRFRKSAFTMKGSWAVLSPQSEPNLSPVYCGHTQVDRLVAGSSHRFIDTGAYRQAFREGRLTLVEHSLAQKQINHQQRA